MKQSLGFTLIELLVVIFIISTLSVIAYPSYQHFLIKVRRAEAQTELTKAQIVQSSYHIINPDYLTDVKLTGLPLNHEFYDFSVVSASNNTYLMKAVVKVNTNQSNDEVSCQTLFINQDSKKTSDGFIDNISCW